MSIWKTDESNVITVITSQTVDLEAMYVQVGTSDNYTTINTPFIQSGDRHRISHTFNTPGNYIIKVVDNNSNMQDVISELDVQDETSADKLDNIFDEVISIPQDVWSYGTREVTNEYQLTPADVWNYTARSLTDTDVNLIEVNGVAVTLDDFKATIDTVDLSGIPSAVWNYASRTTVSTNELTPSEVWTYANRSLTDKTADIVSVNSTPVTLDDFKATISSVDLSGIPADVWGYINRSLTDPWDAAELHGALDSYTNKDTWKADVSSLAGLPANIWSYANRELTAEAFDPAAVWSHAGRTITNFESESHAALNSYTNKDAWKATDITLDTSAIPGEVWSYVSRELTSENNYTPQEIWEYSSRSLTDKTADVRFVGGNVVSSADDFKADVSSLATMPAQVWSYNTRGLTEDVTMNLNPNDFKADLSGVISSIASIETDIGNLPQDNDVNVIGVAGTLVTSVNDFKADVDIDLSNIPQQVWNYTGRSLTSNPGLTTSQELKIDNILSDIGDLPQDNDVNIVSVSGLSVDISDFNVQQDLSTLPSDVWTYANRALTSSVILDSGVTSSISAIESKVVTLNNYDDSQLVAKIDSKPSLVDIENSTILAKETSIGAISTLIDNLPSLLEIRDEMIDVQFGGLEIANNQMTIKDKQGTVIAIFDLFDKNGLPTMGAVYKRTNV